ncbi:ejaculatory bulb-specific protein 3 [Halyomorpha halys]|uniref:ejaculatory bulb-specific protein 3 n=1 Tax=Halyomorpha halys TaxID=286706 RepID=UPI0034D3009F
MNISSVAAVLLVGFLYSSCEAQLLGGTAPLDVGRILSDRGYVQQQLNCVLGRGQCDAIGNQLRLVIPEVLSRNCRICTPQQAQTARNVINFISQNYPNEWSQIQSRFTPQSSG